MGRGKSAQSLALIEACYRILAEIQPATVRAVCYRLFTLKWIDSMEKRCTSCTNRISRLLTDARKEGRIPWRWIVDETQAAERPPRWEDPQEFVEAAKRSYRIDRWAYQHQRVEIWSEKGTVRGTLAPVLREYGITFRVMHGFGSTTALYEVVREAEDDAEPRIVLYAGDYDPSGLYMSQEDLPGRLADFEANIDITRIALTLAQTRTQEGTLPSFPAEDKRADTRYGWFVAHYGNTCWS